MPGGPSPLTFGYEMKTTATVACISALVGAVVSGFVTYSIVSSSRATVQHTSGDEEPPQPPEAVPIANVKTPIASDGASIVWSDRLDNLSGKWVSADGEQSAELDYRMLHFGDTADWPDLNSKTFLIGREMQFLSDDGGIYTICTFNGNPDEMHFIKEDSESIKNNSELADLTSLLLYREGSPNARSRKPLGEKKPPAKAQALLDAIPSIEFGERKDALMARLGLADDDSLELLLGERSMGESDLIFSLGIDSEWMLKLAFTVDSPNAEESEAVIRRFQLFRGYVDDVREGRLDVQKHVYPYFGGGKVIAKPNGAEQDAGDQTPAAVD